MISIRHGQGIFYDSWKPKQYFTVRAVFLTKMFSIISLYGKHDNIDWKQYFLAFPGLLESLALIKNGEIRGRFIRV